MMAVRLEGRLGNQLFQYAFIYAASKKNGTRFYLDKSVDYLLLDKYFNIERDFCQILDDHVFSIKGFKLIFSHYARWSFYYLLKHLFFLKEETFSNLKSPSSQFDKVKDGRIYFGHFQSEEYFLNYKADINRLFSIKDIYKNQFDDVFKSLPKKAKYVVVHVRRTDYIQHNWALVPQYYHEAIKGIHHEKNYYIFISDDFDFVKSEFGYLTNKYLSQNEEIIDFQFLTKADICILSNSSFSWWGAWLNGKPGKTIIAPKLWLGEKTGQEYPAKIIQAEWILL